MIISVTDLRAQIDCGEVTDDLIKTKLNAIESVIRAYTNNNFQMRGVRFVGYSDGMYLYGNPRYLNVGDTVQISASQVNDGLYEIVGVGDDYIQVDRVLNEVDYNLVTKVSYPADVIQCAVDLYSWKQNMGAKVGIKSETLSRHSVTYEDSATLFMGYPIGILNGLNLYKKARC